MENVRLTEEQLRLLPDCQSFVDVVNRLSEDQFTYKQADGKWSVADVMQHLYLSARPIARLMTGPREVLLQWGKSDASSRTYDTISSTYQQILQTTVKAPAVFTPRPEDMDVDKSTIVERFLSVYQDLLDALGNWTDRELDGYIIPHPALGKLTVREMIHFTSAHTQHHLRLLPKA
ncbi:DinB family protein [Spirosoma validum]|uniref:DinB family protein n=1 Tax=Spirosoma validum TaxID=2771355 RepID=A0A927AZ44_9BACT|nr:DinB family protein [Spirosoma validum]MBD2752443.1 DinB family protein [Spirosoma validum]